MKSIRSSLAKRYPGQLAKGLRSRYGSGANVPNGAGSFMPRSVRRLADEARRPRLIDTSRYSDAPKPSTLYEDLYGAGIDADWTDFAQGLAFGRGHWFVTTTKHIWRFPDTLGFKWAESGIGVHLDFSDTLSSLYGGEWNHLGGCTYDEHTDRLYVAVEKSGGDYRKAIFAFDFDLTWLGWAHITGFDGGSIVPQIASPWCAVRSASHIAGDGILHSHAEGLAHGQRLEHGVLYPRRIQS